MKEEQSLLELSLTLLTERGVKLEDIAELVLHLQNKYIPDLLMEECLENVQAVLGKREVQHAIITGIEFDKLAEENRLSQPLNSILTRDEGLYGIDEILGLSIVNLYGSIGFTNYGYLDKTKPGIIGRLDSKAGHGCHTFLDDIVCAIAASAASRIAHNDPEKSSIANQK